MRFLTGCLRNVHCKEVLGEFILDISVEDICEMRSKLTNGKACGLDKVHPEFFKYAGTRVEIDEIDKCLHLIFTQCIEFSKIPAYWRNGVVTLLFKGGNTPDNPGDYRPITLLPIIGKLMTKIMANE